MTSFFHNLSQERCRSRCHLNFQTRGNLAVIFSLLEVKDFHSCKTMKQNGRKMACARQKQLDTRQQKTEESLLTNNNKRRSFVVAAGSHFSSLYFGKSVSLIAVFPWNNTLNCKRTSKERGILHNFITRSA